MKIVRILLTGGRRLAVSVGLLVLVQSAYADSAGNSVTEPQDRGVNSGVLTGNPPITPASAPTLVDPSVSELYQAQIGKTVIKPVFDKTRLEPARCDVSCDMFVPRQSVVHLQSPMVTSTTVRGVNEAATLRIDTTALPNGFETGSFSTVELQNLAKLEFVPQTSIPLAPHAQTLFNQVRDWKIVDRPRNLPVFESQDLMLKSLPSMAPATQSLIREDIRTGSLNQARILGKTAQMLAGKPYEVLSIVGLSPGMTYQFRVVNQVSNKAETVSIEECHIPVCPADFRR